MSVPTTSPTPHTVEALLRVVEERDSEVLFLKRMVDKLTLQLLRARRARYGRSSEQLDDPQIALIEGTPLYEHPAPKAVPKADAAKGAGIVQSHITEGCCMLHAQLTTEAVRPAILRLPEVMRLTGLGRSTIYRLLAAGQFP